MHRELIAIARELAVRDTGRPKRASLARSASTAYNALFHRLTAFCAVETIGWRFRDQEEFRLVYRSLDHGRSKSMFVELVQDREAGQSLRLVGQAFIALQRERHSADYDHDYNVSRNAVRDLIDRAEEAIEVVDGLGADEKRKLLARLLGSGRRRS